MKHSGKKFIPLIFLLLVGLIGYKGVQAADGSLIINNEVITGTDKEKNAEVTSQTPPDLFLPDKTTKVDIEKAQEQLKVEDAKAIVFTGKESIEDTGNQVKTLSNKLFTPKWQESYVIAMATRSDKENTPTTIPNWLWGILIGMAVLSATALGIYLGRKYAHWFKGGKSENSY